jgi:phospholipid/cholesterol/gamma-HCH transport system permease protein
LTKGKVSAASDSELETDVQVRPDGYAQVTLRGWLDSRTVVEAWNQLEEALPAAKIATLEIDASGLLVCDGTGLALLRYLNMGKMTPQAKVSVVGLEAQTDKIFRGFTAEDYEAFRPASRIKCHSLPVETGMAVRSAGADLREMVAFLGEVVAKLPVTIWNRKRMRWPEVRRVFESAGANAVPIVSLISVLVGLIIAFEAAEPLAKFGAQIYVTNMIGLVMVRELGPPLAAVLLAGRSGSAFAAEIGTMKVNEELNALETFGLDPVRFLVVQRITAGILLTPLLTFYATFMGVLGGVLVTLGLRLPLTLIFHQLVSAVHVSDVVFAFAKGRVFGAIVSWVGCLRGMQTQQGPSAVGISTTRAVVTSILLIVIADAVFSILFFALKS